MATTNTNTGATFTGAAHTTGRGNAATMHNTDAKPMNRTILWVAIGLAVLAVVIWFATRDNDGVGQDTMDRRTSGQTAPTPTR